MAGKMVLPSEGNNSCQNNGLPVGLGKSTSVDLQRLSTVLPKSSRPKAPSIVGRFAVTCGRDPRGFILELDDGSHQSVNCDGELLGTFRTRIEASQALSGVQA